MVDYAHLSAGNSEDSSSRDLFAEFGISKPNSPISDNLGQELVPSDKDMGESIPVPVVPSFGSESSSENESLGQNSNLGLATATAGDLQDVFKAAHHFIQQDKIEVVEERTKNMRLMEFILAHGFTSSDINGFLSDGKVVRKINDYNMFEICPQRSSNRPEGTSSDKCKGANPSSVNEMAKDPEEISQQVQEGLLSKPNDETNGGLGTTKVLKTWSSVVAQGENKKKIVLDYCPPPPNADGDTIVVRPPREVLMRGNNLWNTSLVGGFLNCRLPFKYVEENAHKMWDKYGLQKVYMQSKGYFIFKFANSDDRENVLALGPWYIANKLMILNHWREGFDFSSEVASKVPVWVKFHQIPLSYWNPEGLSFLASCIGKPLMLDRATESMEPMSFARICVEISTDSNFPDKVEAIVLDESNGKELAAEVAIEYQNRPHLCTNCKTFGHSLFKCPRANFQWVPKNVVVDPTSSTAKEKGTEVSEEAGSSDATPKNVSDEGWKVISKKAKTPAPADFSGSHYQAVTNQFTPIAKSLGQEGSSFSDVDVSPSPNPLVDKLKLVDEKDGKDLMKNDDIPVMLGKKSKKKGKGGNNGRGAPYTRS